MQYSNPRMKVIVEDWPWGSDLRTTATFTVEVHPTRGERAARTTVDPKTGRISAPHRLTYAHSVCFVDGDDGKLYILEDTGTHYSIMKSTMAHQHETVFPQDGPQYADLTFLFNELDEQRALQEQNSMPEEEPTETVKIVSKKVRVRKMAAAVPANGGESKIAMREAATEAELDAIFGADADVVPQEAPTAIVEPEAQALPALEACTHALVTGGSDRMFPYRCLQCDTQLTTGALPDQVVIVGVEPQASPDELPEPHDTIREMTVDTQNRDAYRAELASREDEDDMRPVATWTSAPCDYDGFGTVTVQDNVAVYCGKTIRKVETPIRHLTWQRQRYGSGLHTAVGATEWKAIQASPGYARENGQNLLNIIDTQPLAQALETLKAQETEETTIQPASAIRSAHAQYLLDLVAQGDAAIEAALARRTVTVKLPGTDATRPRTPREPRTCDDAPKAPLTPRQIQALLEREQLGHFASNSSSTRELLRRKGVLASNQMNAELTPHGQALVATLRATMQTPAALAS